MLHSINLILIPLLAADVADGSDVITDVVDFYALSVARSFADAATLQESASWHRATLDDHVVKKLVKVLPQ